MEDTMTLLNNTPHYTSSSMNWCMLKSMYEYVKYAGLFGCFSKQYFTCRKRETVFKPLITKDITKLNKVTGP